MTRYSNCLFAAMKAKLKWGKQVKVIFIPPWKNDVFCPHWMWLHTDSDDNEWILDWYAEKKEPLKWYEELWHKGWIRKRPASVYYRWLRTREWRADNSNETK